MSYRNMITYPPDWEFSIQELSLITPEMIQRWFAFKVFAKKDSMPDDNPTYGKSNTLLACKKMLSFFMINCLPLWDVVNKSGNPTKSTAFNDLIAFVKKKETHGQGKEYCTDRALSTANSRKFWIFFTSHYH